jgi:hypothetical protein
MTKSTESVQIERLAAQRIADLLSRGTATFIRLWNYPLLKHIWVRALLFISILGFCAARAYIGLSGTQMFSHDAFMLLDGAWRMMHGQRPHIDFYSHMGVLTFAPTVAGLWMAQGTAAAFGYGQALTGLVLGLWSYCLCRNRLADVPAVLMTLAVTLMASAPAALGFSPVFIAPAMTYNRCGYAILALTLVEAAAERPRNSRPSDLLGGLSTGAAFAILLFLKITYFVFGGFLILAVSALRPQAKQRWTGLGIGFLALFSVFAAYFSFNLKPMLLDFLTVAAAKHFRIDWYQVDVILELAATLFILNAMGAALLFLRDRWQAGLTLGITGSAGCIVGLILLLGNYEQTGFPLAVFLAILVINAVIVCIPNPGHPSRALHGSVLFLGSVFIVIFLGVSAFNFPYGIAVKIFKARHFPALDSPVLKNFVPVDGDLGYTAYVNQGLALVRDHALAGETVMSLDFTNPFSYGLGMKPAPGGTTVIQYKTTFDDRHRQSPQSLFGRADLVMTPNPGCFSDPTLDYSIPRLYGPYLESHFNLVAKSQYWSLYRRQQ